MDLSDPAGCHAGAARLPSPGRRRTQLAIEMNSSHSQGEEEEGEAEDSGNSCTPAKRVGVCQIQIWSVSKGDSFQDPYFPGGEGEQKWEGVV